MTMAADGQHESGDQSGGPEPTGRRCRLGAPDHDQPTEHQHGHDDPRRQRPAGEAGGPQQHDHDTDTHDDEAGRAQALALDRSGRRRRRPGHADEHRVGASNRWEVPAPIPSRYGGGPSPPPGPLSRSPQATVREPPSPCSVGLSTASAASRSSSSGRAPRTSVSSSPGVQRGAGRRPSRALPTGHDVPGHPEELVRGVRPELITEAVPPVGPALLGQRVLTVQPVQGGVEGGQVLLDHVRHPRHRELRQERLARGPHRPPSRTACRRPGCPRRPTTRR